MMQAPRGEGELWNLYPVSSLRAKEAGKEQACGNLSAKEAAKEREASEKEVFSEVCV